MEVDSTDNPTLNKADRWSSAKRCLGDVTFKTIQEAKVLVIGAGGIGCELLKNLVLSGFKYVEIVDLDTIDISNLNRQFLFRRKHVGQPKSVVARESALLYTADDSECRIEAHHDDVKTLKYGPEFVKQFDIVLNALDNMSARRHVGRVCWSAGVPYVESGTAGWFGQVQPFIPGKTGCYECEEKIPPATFPVCTIRSTPSKPIHTIMWAKHLFNRLFGKEDEENAVTDLSSSTSLTSTEAQAQELKEELKAAIAQDSIDLEQKKSSGDYAQFVFHKVFTSDILQVNTLTNLWAERAPPKPISFYLATTDPNFAAVPTSNGLLNASSATLEDQKLWSIQKCAQVFVDTCNKLKKMTEDGTNLSWDKDEPLHLDFVVAASNLRSNQYGIPNQSRFTVKSDAGNIIPAIATTNAIIAGLIVIEAIKILTQRIEDCQSVFLVQKIKGRNSVLRPETKPFKNPKCYVCSNQFVHIKIDTLQTTLRTFVKDILEKQLGVLEATVMVGDDIIYESDEDFEHQLDKTLDEVKIKHSSVVHVESFSFEFKLEISIEHAPASSFEEPTKLYQIVGSVAPPTESTSEPASTVASSSNYNGENAQAASHAEHNKANGSVSDSTTTTTTTSSAAKMQADDENEPKRVKSAPPTGADVINLDDDDDDLVILDAPPPPPSSSLPPPSARRKRALDDVKPAAEGEDEISSEAKRPENP